MTSCPSRMTDVEKHPNQHCKTCGMTFISKSDTNQYPIVDTEVCIGCVVKQVMSEIFARHGMRFCELNNKGLKNGKH